METEKSPTTQVISKLTFALSLPEFTSYNKEAVIQYRHDLGEKETTHDY